MTVHFVGAGPGAADLITMRAATLLAQADVVLYPGTYLDATMLTHCGEQAQLVDTQALNLDEIVDYLIEADRVGREVVRLTSGDPSFYSALSEQTRRLDRAEVAWDVCPGVAAFSAAAASVGRELTVPLVAQSVVLTRPQSRSSAMPETESLVAFAATRSTLALHLGVTRTRELMATVEPHYGADCPVVVVYRASQPGEVVLRGTVADVADRVDAAGLRQAALILVGRALAGPGGESFLYSVDRDRA